MDQLGLDDAFAKAGGAQEVNRDGGQKAVRRRDRSRLLDQRRRHNAPEHAAERAGGGLGERPDRGAAGHRAGKGRR